MAYCTLQQLIDKYGQAMLIQLTDRADVPADAIDTAIVNAAIADADAVINEHIAQRYAVPVAGSPASLADIAKKIAIYNLHVSEPEAKIVADYKDCMTRLAAVAAGKITLTDVAGIEAAPKDGNGVEFTDRERDFTPETMKGFV
jgi:phage gp36-like protein